MGGRQKIKESKEINLINRKNLEIETQKEKMNEIKQVKENNLDKSVKPPTQISSIEVQNA